MRKIIAIDGHDGSGKTSICKRICELLNYQYIKPFSNSLGDLIAWMITSKNYELANQIAMSAIDKALVENPEANIVFDRHWISMFTVIPERLQKEWRDTPFSILCWAEPQITINRLQERKDAGINKWDNEYFCKKYMDISDQFQIPVINTSYATVDESVERALKIIQDDWRV